MFLLSYQSYLLTEPPEDAEPEEDDELPPLPVSAVPQEMVPESEESDDLAE